MITALLTVDDIASRNTPAMVDYLNQKGIKAIFFATGQYVERFYDEALYALKNGMLVGNHSYSHPAFSTLTVEEGIKEIDQCEAVLDRLYRDAGVERRYRPFRFPYGDKGGDNHDAFQRYLREKRFDKVDDTPLPYDWWKRFRMNTDIDTFWTYDFEEYRLHLEPFVTEDYVWDKMHDPNPERGEGLLVSGHRHILLLHAHDETEALMSEYYRRFIDHLLENGVTFVEPRFIPADRVPLP